MPDDLAALILTNRRPDNVRTYGALRRHGYTGPIILVVDDEDPTLPDYLNRYGDEVEVFSKRRIAAQTQLADNFETGKGSVIFARNAAFDVAEQRGYRDFIQLDDDYTGFAHKYDGENDVRELPIQNLDAVLAAMRRFFRDAGFTTLAMMQGGDFLGGPKGSSVYVHKIMLARKAMNSFLCSTDRRFWFSGRINEDVSAYCLLGSQGLLIGSINQVMLHQVQTQAQQGGMGDLYRQQGTYAKSFYTVLHCPSFVSIAMMNSRNVRIHHQVQWSYAVPKILSPEHRKERSGLMNDSVAHELAL